MDSRAILAALVAAAGVYAVLRAREQAALGPLAYPGSMVWDGTQFVPVETGSYTPPSTSDFWLDRVINAIDQVTAQDWIAPGLAPQLGPSYSTWGEPDLETPVWVEWPTVTPTGSSTSAPPISESWYAGEFGVTEPAQPWSAPIATPAPQFYAPPVFEPIVPTSRDVTPWGEPMSSALANAPANVRAFLFAIRVGEGTADPLGYYRKVGGGEFQTFRDHPIATGEMQRVYIPNIRDYSTAAGAYQILYKFWPHYKSMLGLRDFSPDSQDRYAIHMLKETGAYNRLIAGDFAGAVSRAASRWASLPGAGYGQREEQIQAVANYYANFGGSFA